MYASNKSLICPICQETDDTLTVFVGCINAKAVYAAYNMCTALEAGYRRSAYILGQKMRRSKHFSLENFIKLMSGIP
jgi:hypothetical protein